MRKFKKFISVVSFQIGVNIIGLPQFHDHLFKQHFAPAKSKFF